MVALIGMGPSVKRMVVSGVNCMGSPVWFEWFGWAHFSDQQGAHQQKSQQETCKDPERVTQTTGPDSQAQQHDSPAQEAEKEKACRMLGVHDLAHRPGQAGKKDCA